MIELELFEAEPNGRNSVLRRDIFKQGNRSHFYKNNLGMKSKEVSQFVAGLNIQINNLCQFLPQEKVTEFSNMNPVELLEKTEQAVGEPGLYEAHQDLKDYRNREKELKQQLKDKEDHLSKLLQQNERVERDVQRFQERQKTLEKIETMERKKIWLQYDEKRVLFDKCNKKKKETKAMLAQKQGRADPLEENLQKATKKARALEQQMKEQTTEISKQEGMAKRKKGDLRDLQSKIDEVQDDFKDKKAQEQARLKKIHEWKQQVAGWKRELEQLEPDENIQPQLNQNRGEMNRLAREADEIESKCSNIRNDRESLRKEIKALQDRLKKLNDQKDQRLRALRNRSPDTVNAVIWLRSNQDKFKRTIHEPIALVLNIEDKNHAKYIERAIPGQDMLAFVCEDSEDQDRFIAEVREKQNLRVSVVKSPAEPLTHFRPPMPIDRIGFGFHSYLKDLVTAPEAVMTYLCKLHKVHTIPLGSEETERMVDQVIERCNLSKFYTPEYHYSIKQSRYGNRNKSSQSSIVQEARILGASIIDMSEKRELEMTIQEKEKQLHSAMTEYGLLERQHRELTTQIDQLKDARTVLIRSKNQRRSIQQNINAKIESIKKKEGAAMNLEGEKLKAEQKIKEISGRKLTHIKKICELNKICLDKSMQKVRLSLQHQMWHKTAVQCENDIREIRAENVALETQLQELTEQTEAVKKEAKELLAAARRKTGSDKPSDHLRKAFEDYPNDIDKLDDLIHREQAQADCQFPTDESVVRDYEKRKKEIRNVEVEVSQKGEELDNHQTRIAELKRTWLQQLQELVSNINTQFCNFFTSMGCAGEVDLHYPHEEEYDKYGIRIRVKFRRNEQLQLLTSTYQSGGERSVSTILYLMALQELNKCPFRVVDEINQGMDPSNERKVFEFVVETACRENTSQYFLITPKLLPNLKYGPKMKVLCIYNSHWMLSHKEWDINKCIRTKDKMKRGAHGDSD